MSLESPSSWEVRQVGKVGKVGKVAKPIMPENQMYKIELLGFMDAPSLIDLAEIRL